MGPVEVLVNNAGITRDGMFHKMTADNWGAVINTNLNSLFNMTPRRHRRHARPQALAGSSRSPRSTARRARWASPTTRPPRPALIGFTKALAQENAFKGITVNVVAPGYIATEMVRAVPEEVLNSKIIPQIPVGRLGEAEEVAK